MLVYNSEYSIIPIFSSKTGQLKEQNKMFNTMNGVDLEQAFSILMKVPRVPVSPRFYWMSCHLIEH